MEPFRLNLPDFSKGETPVDVCYPSFEPLFAEYNQSAEFTSTDADNALSDMDDLAGLSSAIAELGDIECNLADQATFKEESGPSLIEHESILNDLTKHHSDEIDELNAKHQEEVLRHLEELQSKTIEMAATRIETALARSLSNLYQERLTEVSVKELAKQIHPVVHKLTIDRLQISGPSSLASALVAALPNTSLPIDVEENDSVDLLVSFDDKNISTNIGAWMKQLEKALSP